MFLFLLICLASGTLIGILGITYKLGTRYGHDPDDFRVMMNILATASAFVAVLFTGESIAKVVIWIVGSLCGLCFYLAVISVMKAMQVGPISFTWVLINASIIIPILGTALIWSVPVTALQWGGVLCFGLSLLLFGKDLSAGNTGRASSRWIVAATMMFISNGLLLLLFNVLDRHTNERHTFSVLVVLYLVASMLFIIRKRSIRVPNVKVVTLSIVAALCLMGGQALIIRALSINTASALPIIHGTSILVVAIISAIRFGERFSVFSTGGVITSIVSMALLTSQAS